MTRSQARTAALFLAIVATMAMTETRLYGQQVPSLDELENSFQRAKRDYTSLATTEVVREQLSGLIANLDDGRWTGQETSRANRLLVESLALRAELDFNQEQPVSQDLRRILGIDPSFHFDPDWFSQQLIDELDRLRSTAFGSLDLRIEPPDAEVRLDGRLVHPAAGPLRFAMPSGGKLRITAQKPGYRDVLLEINAADAHLKPQRIVMRPDRSTLTIHAEPSDATVTIDGGELGRQILTAPVQIELKPGTYLVDVSKPGYITQRWRALKLSQDGRYLEVKLNPAGPPRGKVALIGILGDAEGSARRLRQGLTATSVRLENWEFLDRSEAGSKKLRELGIGAGPLRSAAKTGRLLQSGIDWQKIQSLFEGEVGVWVTILAVLSDDLVAAEADLWFLPASPGPAVPDYRRVKIQEPDSKSLVKVFSDLDRPLELERVSFGALLLDSDAAEGPVVADVGPGSAAAGAGLQVGDEMLSIAGVRVHSSAEARHQMEAATPGQALDLRVHRAGQGETLLRLRLATSRAVIRHNAPDVIYAAIAGKMSQPDFKSAPGWQTQLHLGKALLNSGAWRQAFQELETVSGIPERPGLGKATADYWLGVALQAVGTEHYDLAIEAFRRAATVQGARLNHDDGPLVAPRANARLAELTAAGY